MNGEPVLVMLIEDNIDHAELVLRTLEDHDIAKQSPSFSGWAICTRLFVPAWRILRIDRNPAASGHFAGFTPAACRWHGGA